MSSYDVRADAQRAAEDRGDYYRDPGTGLVAFAAVMLGLAGTFNVLEGMLAIADSRVFVANSIFVFSNLNAWGWIILALGTVQLVASGTLLGGSEWGRWLGIGAACVNAIGQLLFMAAYPFWALTMLAIDIVIIYALVVYGGKQLRGGF